LKLLSEHPSLTIQKIADKLGIGERYLHKLLIQNVGISPKNYQLFSQVLLAKQLLHQTSLSVEQVAQSVGFSNSRRLQASIKKVTNLSPLQIRKQSKREQADGIELQLSYRPPYDWPSLRDFLADRAITPIEEVGEDYYARFFSVPGNADAGHFTARHLTGKNAFTVNIKFDAPHMLQTVINQIRRVLDLDADPFTIEEGLTSTGLSSSQITSGLRLPGVWSEFEAGCRAIIGQQISVKAAIKQLQSICDELNSNGNGAFPTPEMIANIDSTILRMPESRKSTLKQFAKLFCEGNKPSIEEMLKVKGIGPWTINYIKLRGQSDPDMFLQTDLVVMNKLKAVSIEPSKAAPWRSYLTLQLWQLPNK
jgi:AraC family transcriptional regulator of adaptative response / DNA-3-methyladenine glycosylase II